MIIVECSRTEMLEHVASSQAPNLYYRECEYGSPVYANSDVALIYVDRDHRENGRPCCILLTRGTLEEFFAWTQTYVQRLKPISAFLRVMPIEYFNDISTRTKVSNPALARAAVGTILAEAVMEMRTKSISAALTPSSCASTLSSALAKAAFSGYGVVGRNEVAVAWGSTRKMCRQPVRVVPTEGLQSIWTSFWRDTPAGYRSDQVPFEDLALAIREIEGIGRISDSVWFHLVAGDRRLSRIQEAMEDTREVRVRAFDVAVNQLRSVLQDRSPVHFAFCAAYLVSRIAPGSLDHIELLLNLGPEGQLASLWLGAIAGIHPNSTVLWDQAGTGARVLRDLESNDGLLSSPKCDFAVNELEVILRRETGLRDIPTNVSGQARVELSPMVDTVVSWGVEDAPNEMVGARDDEAVNIILELGSALNRAGGLYSDLVRRFVDGDVERRRRGGSSKKKR